MKKLSYLFLTSLIISILIILVSGGRGYTKDNFSNRSKNSLIKENYYYENLSKSVVQLLAVGDGSTAFGTGFFINNEKTIVTNYHVVKNANKIFLIFNENKYAYEVKLLAYDSQNDIAILKAEGDFEFDYLPLAIDTKKNEDVYTCGFSNDYVVTYGKIIDTKSKYKNNMYIDISNNVKSGNSGGPALNNKGEVIGIVTLGNSVSTSLVPAYKLYDFVYDLNISL